MLGAGIGATALGTLLVSTAWYDSEVVAGSGLVLLFTGAASTLASIPIIISSATKARKAGQLSLGLNSAGLINPNGASQTTYPTLKISVHLNSSKR